MGWKIYFCALLIILILANVTLFSNKANVTNYIDAATSVIVLAGLYGYAFKIKIFCFRFWKIIFFGIIIWDIINVTLFNAHYGLGITIDLIIMIVSLLITLPGYIAVYLYGFKSDILI